MTTEAKKIVAKGVPVTLSDGSVRTLRFGMRQNAEIEDQFGSLGDMQDAMAPIANALEGVDENDEDAVSEAVSHAKFFKPLSKAIACGLVARDFCFDDAWDALELSRMGEYVPALFEALNEGNQEAQTTVVTPAPEVPLPPPAGASSGPQVPETILFPGHSSTSSLQPNVGVVTSSS